VLRGNEVDVVTTDLLKFQHHLGQPFGPGLRAVSNMADIEVLAELAPEVAPREEDRAAPIPAAQTVLLTEVCEITANTRIAARFAGCRLIRQPIHAAITRTYPAGPKTFKRLLRSLLQFTCMVQAQVGRFEFLGRKEEF
jgi:hypothetical protein